jgi:hypothetical protein
LIHCEYRSDNRVWQSRSREKFTERCLLAFFFPLALRSQTEIAACSTHNRRGTGEMRRAELICGRHFYVVDDQNIHGRLSGFQLQTQLLLDCGEQIGGRCGIGGRRGDCDP